VAGVDDRPDLFVLVGVIAEHRIEFVEQQGDPRRRLEAPVDRGGRRGDRDPAAAVGEELEAFEQPGLAGLLLRARDREIRGRLGPLDCMGMGGPKDDGDDRLRPRKHDVAAQELLNP
jgi:hypothetical protein